MSTPDAGDSTVSDAAIPMNQPAPL
jgi:hypothetical protein